MAIPIARVHLKMAHSTLPALLPIPPKCKMLPCPCVAAIRPKLLATTTVKPTSSRADADVRWDAHKTKSASPKSSASSSLRSTCADSSVRSSAGRGSSRKSATSSPPRKPGRADAVERWDAHKKAAIPPKSLSPSGTPPSSVVSRTCAISRASSAERWDMHKKRCPTQGEPLEDDESSSTGTNDMDTEEEEIVWKPRAMYAGSGFTAAAPQPSMLPMPTSFLVPVA